ncbi:ankyrin repeat and BTB/POZ domain-containing protein 2-like [Pollicipes pollicipes]|uniref:ankyrin repeat and BTB/POZ domain-containing protein 2-like n=1 Tax=Pollicipes pollicipes TaxID=41117 RepID=UPI0018853A81|nr:ankyrin repeat and BTB/POZ domain-containing protein 2-like [Pollicipes pollicipes]
MASASAAPPEFREAEQYRRPERAASEGHPIIRPKPRRPGELSLPSPDAAFMLRPAPSQQGLPPAGAARPPAAPAAVSPPPKHGPLTEAFRGPQPQMSRTQGRQRSAQPPAAGAGSASASPQTPQPLYPVAMYKSPLQRQSPAPKPSPLKEARGPPAAAPSPQAPPPLRLNSPPVRLTPQQALPEEPPQTPPERDVGYASAWAEIPSRSYHAKVANVTAERPLVLSPAAAQYWAHSQGVRQVRGELSVPLGEPAPPGSAGSSLERHQPAEASGQRDPTPGESDKELPAEAGRQPSPPRPAADCGTLDKSSSENDAIMSRKRPPTKLKSRRRNILSFPQHLNADDLRCQRRPDPYGGGSSSDENRSSGHASMSDGHTSSSPPAETLPRHQHYRSQLRSVPEARRRRRRGARGPSGPLPLRSGRHRTKDDLTLQLESASGLDDIKQAIEQLTIRSQGSRTSYSTSTYSSMSGSESEPARRLIRHSSLETVNTNVTAADEFVWVDSHNRLVELQQLPWSSHDVLRVIQNGRVKEQMERVSMEAVPRLAYLLQRAIVRVAREAQRLARALGMCSKREVLSALRIVLSPALSDTCSKACLRAAAMYTVSGADQLRQSKSGRAGLQMSVGRFHRWMCDVRLGKFVHEYAAVYLAAGMENLLEEMVLLSLPGDPHAMLTAAALEHSIANSGDFWGLLQPYAHLNAGRTASGALALPRFPSTTSLDSSLSQSPSVGRSSSSSSFTLTAADEQRPARNTQQALLTTCVGTLGELTSLVASVAQYQQRLSAGGTPARATTTWGSSALHTLFYFMRCSQLEHAEHAEHERRAPVQELVYERPYIVLPPLVEWVRVSTAHAEHRHAAVVDKDDVNQAARLLLPGVDCPPRLTGYEELSCPRRQMDEAECARKFKIDLAFRMLSCGRTDLVPHALQLLPSTKGQLQVNTVNESGLSPLMLACIRGDEAMVRLLLDSGSDLDAETPPLSPTHPTANPETQHWTALTYATIHGHASIIRLLLEKGANVEGGARLSEDKCTETPLQVAVASGSVDIVSLLLSYSALPFLSTLLNDSLCYSGAAQKGCYSAIAVASAHGQRAVLHQLLSHPLNSGRQEVLSLEEILAEGSSQHTGQRRGNRLQVLPVSVDDPRTSSLGSNNSETSQMLKLTKAQIKALQEAMYHSAENGHLEITLDLRNLGVPWTLHCWMYTLATAHEQRLENIIDQLLQDFLQVWPDDYSSQFVDECLPLLFNIFRYSKNEGTSLLLADIFSSCFGREAIKEIRDSTLTGGPRIDPNFVNNPDLSDVQFRVEGRVFYAHKIILINASPRFKQMLNSKFCDGNPPIVQINDIRYDIFELVMHFLYKGGCQQLAVGQTDVLELMAAANFFQLDRLLRFCEARCAKLVDLDNIVSMYIHAKVYNAAQLLEYCQSFLLQNMVALLTYDDSVRRLIFGKKLHNHDVLAGLQLTLQSRVKAKSKPAS